MSYFIRSENSNLIYKKQGDDNLQCKVLRYDGVWISSMFRNKDLSTELFVPISEKYLILRNLI